MVIIETAPSQPSRPGGRRLEALDDEVDTQSELPEELGGGRELLERAAGLDEPEDGRRAGRDDERTADEAEHGEPARDEAGPVHDEPEDETVPDADHERGSEGEGPLLQGEERVAEDAQA